MNSKQFKNHYQKFQIQILIWNNPSLICNTISIQYGTKALNHLLAHSANNLKKKSLWKGKSSKQLQICSSLRPNRTQDLPKYIRITSPERYQTELNFSTRRLRSPRSFSSEQYPRLHLSSGVLQPYIWCAKAKAYSWTAQRVLMASLWTTLETPNLSRNYYRGQKSSSSPISMVTTN